MANKTKKLSVNAVIKRSRTAAKKAGCKIAIADYNKAIEKELEDYYFDDDLLSYEIDLLDSCNAYFYKKDYDSAIESLSKYIVLNKDDLRAYFCRGCAYYEKKDYELAINDFNKCKELDKEEYIDWIKNIEESGEYDELINFLKEKGLYLEVL